ncbi:MAG: hypothetical protein O2884_14820 [Chloroflexi bacterium]|nr:hypothetical protein [Chloroflexota bacterium]
MTSRRLWASPPGIAVVLGLMIAAFLSQGCGGWHHGVRFEAQNDTGEYLALNFAVINEDAEQFWAGGGSLDPGERAELWGMYPEPILGDVPQLYVTGFIAEERTDGRSTWYNESGVALFRYERGDMAFCRVLDAHDALQDGYILEITVADIKLPAERSAANERCPKFAYVDWPKEQ